MELDPAFKEYIIWLIVWGRANEARRLVSEYKESAHALRNKPMHTQSQQ